MQPGAQRTQREGAVLGGQPVGDGSQPRVGGVQSGRERIIVIGHGCRLSARGSVAPAVRDIRCADETDTGHDGGFDLDDRIHGRRDPRAQQSLVSRDAVRIGDRARQTGHHDRPAGVGAGVDLVGFVGDDHAGIRADRRGEPGREPGPYHDAPVGFDEMVDRANGRQCVAGENNSAVSDSGQQPHRLGTVEGDRGGGCAVVGAVGRYHDAVPLGS
ncbi:Uncharacterised protein [Nocardia africana]|uniref:Uncharacterized protein n=1 Tax=Nocardia africana TaxID=134964 RepID=A0A378WYQ8_9NOCA|nr:Uncharacterised protein [Nocardia africana]